MTKALLDNSPLQQIDFECMQMALNLASRGLGNVWPNPAVGCILLRRDLSNMIVGRGWTQPGGRPHAEVEAIRCAGSLSKGSVAYISLEPCAHFGKTPPCVDQLIAAGITKAFISIQDPDNRVAGRGIAKLKEAGIPVFMGLLEKDARQINEGFLCRIENGRPHITIKLATTLDSKIATKLGQSKWITSEDARKRGQLLRSRCDAVITGVGTAIEDNPRLTCRLSGMETRSPIRIVSDRFLRLPANGHLVADAKQYPTWIVTVKKYPESRAQKLLKKKCELIVVESDQNGRPSISGLCKVLGEKGITRLLVEGGNKLTAAFFQAGLVDELRWFRSSNVLGGDGLAAIGDLEIANLKDIVSFERQWSRVISKKGDIEEIFRRKM